MADDKIVMELGRVMEPGEVQWSQPCDPTAWDTQALHDEAAGSHYGALFMTGGTRATIAPAVMAKAFGSYPEGVAPYLPAAATAVDDEFTTNNLLVKATETWWWFLVDESLLQPATIGSVLAAANFAANSAAAILATSGADALIVSRLPGGGMSVQSAATDAAAGDVRPPPDAPIDRVLGDLSADRIGKADRRRLGDALDAANQRADGTRAKPDEAFGRILRGDGTARLGIVTP